MQQPEPSSWTEDELLLLVGCSILLLIVLASL